MRKRILLVVVLSILLAAGISVWARMRSQSTLTLEPGSTGTAARGWPANRLWNWKFRLPDITDGEHIGLRVRYKSTPLPPGMSPVIEYTTKAMSATEAEGTFESGMHVLLTPPSQTFGTATIQLIDLSEVGAVSATPDRPLRMLATTFLGGSSVNLAGDDQILTGRRFLGYSVRGEGDWIDGELYLMSFWIVAEDTSTRYDVFLEITDGPGR